MTMKYSASEPERQVVYAYADDIKAKDAEIERLRAALKECADDLEAELEAKFASIGQHPAILRKHERDMEPVKTARAVLANG